MKKVWALLRALNAGEWVALTVLLVGMLVAGWGAVTGIWSTIVGSLQPEMVKVKRVDYDLIAQRSMSAAAWWMVIITCVSALVGGLGLYLIARTLIEAKRSADAAEKTITMAQSAARAYLLVDFAKLTFKDDYNAILRYQVSNSGQTPARNISLRVDFYAAEHRTAQRFLVGTSRKSRSDMPFEAKRPAVAMVERYFVNEMTKRMHPEYAVVVVITIEYDDVITPERHKEVCTYGCMVPWMLPHDEEITLFRDVGGETGWGDGDARNDFEFHDETLRRG